MSGISQMAGGVAVFKNITDICKYAADIAKSEKSSPELIDVIQEIREKAQEIREENLDLRKRIVELEEELIHVKKSDSRR